MQPARPALIAALLALGFGLAGLTFLKDVPLGLSWAAWFFGLGAAGLVLAHLNRDHAASPLAFLGLVALSPLLLVHESPTLRTLNLGLIVLLLAVPIMSRAPFGEWGERLGEMAKATLAALVSLIPDGARVALEGFRPAEWVGEHNRERAAAVGRGLLILVPLLAVFGGLLVGADAVLQNQVTSMLRLDLSHVANGFVWFLGASWLAGAFLYRTTLASGAPTFDDAVVGPTNRPPQFDFGTRPPKRGMFGRTEIGIILGGLNMLFMVFVGIQITYLFGGAANVQQVAGLSYAEYARKGFFELLWVTGLALPVLLACQGTLRSRGEDRGGWFAPLATTTVVLLALIVASALKRMGLYVEAYGLTELRLYSTAIMLTLSTVLVWFAVGLFARRAPFALGALAAFTLGVVGLNVLNPDATIARFNLARAERTGQLDLAHLGSLSLDASPAVEAAMRGPQRPWHESLRAMADGWQHQAAKADPRSWTLSGHRVRNAAKPAIVASAP